MNVFTPYINLLNLFLDNKMSSFEEYRAFKLNLLETGWDTLAERRNKHKLL